MGQFIKIFLASAFLVASFTSFCQEYDDMYFTKADRKKKKEKTFNHNQKESYQENDSNLLEENTVSSSINSSGPSFLGKQYQYDILPEDDLSTGYVSNESIERYKSSKTKDDYFDENYSNPNFSNSEDAYRDKNIIVNNYYGNNWNQRNGWNRPQWSFNLGRNNWGGNYWGISYGWNAWNDPFWTPYYNTWGPAWGWNSLGWGGFYDPYWCRPYWGSIYAAGYNGELRGREVVRGKRNSRGGATSFSGRTNNRNLSVADETNSTRNYSRQQRDYLDQSKRSRSTVNTSINNGTNTRSRSISSSNTNGSTRTNSSIRRSNNTRSQSVYTPPSSNTNRSSAANSGSVRSRVSSKRSSGRPSSGKSSSRRGRK